ncbi:phosphatase PAP2 family protein [Streptomyces syringium]|uniref:phosphatase PAP2 family protein n=1 Tax=Streptomyces syringium TaxID=76729 RepID=UPI0034487335
MSKTIEGRRPASGRLPRAGALHTFARVYSGFLSPPVIGLLALAVIGGASRWPSPSGLAWAAVLATGCGAPPAAYAFLAGDRDHSLAVPRLALQRLERGQRITTALVALATLVVGLVLVVGFHGPRQLATFLGFSVGGIAVAAVLTRKHKISVHTGTAGSVLGLLGAEHGSWAILGIALAGVMGWARIRVGAHTPTEVAYGLLFGLAWAFLFVCLRHW